jgi:hypothetical protein
MKTKILALSLLFLGGLAHAGKVEMCWDDSCSKKVKREKLDCTIHKNKKRSLTFGFKLGIAFAAKAGPEVSFGKSAEINWNRMSQDLIRRYEELCDFHNKGHLSVADFDRRYKDLDLYYEKAKDLKVEIEDTVAGRAQKQFADLDAEARKHSGAGDDDSPKDKVERIKGDLDQLSKDVAEYTVKKD